MESVYQEALDLFGDRIVIMHAKDLLLEDNMIKFVPAGKEETTVPYIEETVAYINKIFQEA